MVVSFYPFCRAHGSAWSLAFIWHPAHIPSPMSPISQILLSGICDHSWSPHLQHSVMLLSINPSSSRRTRCSSAVSAPMYVSPNLVAYLSAFGSRLTRRSIQSTPPSHTHSLRCATRFACVRLRANTKTFTSRCSVVTLKANKSLHGNPACPFRSIVVGNSFMVFALRVPRRRGA